MESRIPSCHYPKQYIRLNYNQLNSRRLKTCSPYYRSFGGPKRIKKPGAAVKILTAGASLRGGLGRTRCAQTQPRFSSPPARPSLIFTMRPPSGLHVNIESRYYGEQDSFSAALRKRQADWLPAASPQARKPAFLLKQSTCGVH